MFYVYVLEDDEQNFYKGMTANLERRLNEHKKGKTKTTSKMNNLKIVYFEKYKTSIKARQREKYFKSSAGRRFLKTKNNKLL